MRAADLAKADRVHRLAFAKFFGVDPKTFRPESRAVETRWRTDPKGVLVAVDAAGRMRGSVIVMNWGNVAVLGPLTVHPADWATGVGGRLMRAAERMLDRRGFVHTALFTHPQSPGHLRLYQRHGFWPGALHAVMSRAVVDSDRSGKPEAVRLDALGATAREAALAGCRSVARAVFRGLDLTREIEGLAAQTLGDTLVLRRGRAVRGFAICHFRWGSEARAGALYVKFAAVGPGDADGFARLVAACEALAAEHGLERVTAGVSTARLPAYQALIARGYRADMYGVAMHRPAGPGWDLPDRFVIDDLR